MQNEEKDKKNKTEKINTLEFNMSTIGSDEVGTGDYFGPIVVTATFVSKDNIEFLSRSLSIFSFLY